MSIDVPSAGDPILDTWGADVAEKLNKITPLLLTAAVATNSASADNIAEWSFPVVDGNVYSCQLHGSYYANATNQGIKFGYTGPAGAGHVSGVILGNGSDTGATRFWSGDGSLAGRTSTDGTGRRGFWLAHRFAATASGTMYLQFARGGTSGAPGITITKGSGGLLIEETS